MNDFIITFLFLYLHIFTEEIQRQRLGIGLFTVLCTADRTSDLLSISATSDRVAQITCAPLNVSHAPLVSRSDAQPETGL